MGVGGLGLRHGRHGFHEFTRIAEGVRSSKFGVQSSEFKVRSSGLARFISAIRANPCNPCLSRRFGDSSRALPDTGSRSGDTGIRSRDSSRRVRDSPDRFRHSGSRRGDSSNGFRDSGSGFRDSGNRFRSPENGFRRAFWGHPDGVFDWNWLSMSILRIPARTRPQNDEANRPQPEHPEEPAKQGDAGLNGDARLSASLRRAGRP